MLVTFDVVEFEMLAAMYLRRRERERERKCVGVQPAVGGER